MKPKSPAPHTLDPEAQLVAKIEEVRKERARLVKLPNTATAVGQTHKLEAELLRELREVRAAVAATPANPAADMTDEQLYEGVCQSVADWPDVWVDRLLDAVMQKRTGRPQLKVVE